MEYHLQIKYYQRPLLRHFAILFLTFLITLIFLLVFVNIFTCWIHVLVEENINLGKGLIQNGYVDNLFFVILTFSSVGYQMDFIVGNFDRGLNFDLSILFIELFGMIFYGWIIGFTLSNLSRNNHL